LDPVQEKLLSDLQLVRGIGCVGERESTLNQFTMKIDHVLTAQEQLANLLMPDVYH
jgi:hypothetical protein